MFENIKKIMYNRIYTYLYEINPLFQKQEAFRDGHSTSHAHNGLVGSICDSFNQNRFADLVHLLDLYRFIFIDLLKVFGTVAHNVLLERFCLYGIKTIAFKPPFR